MSERVSVAQAAKEMGCCTQAVREQMKRGLIDIGFVAPSMRRKSKYRPPYRYFIYREKLNKLLGKE